MMSGIPATLAYTTLQEPRLPSMLGLPAAISPDSQLDKQAMTASFFPIPSLAKQTPKQLETRLANLIHECVSRRSAAKAGAIVQHIEALCAHPDYQGTWEERCSYRRLARQWGCVAWLNAEQTIS